MSICDVQNQPRAHRVIQRAIAGARMPHAYMFTGPEGVGREMMAVRLAQVLLCASPVRRPAESAAPTADAGEYTDACGTCDDCRLVQAGTHPDLHVIYRQLNREHSDARIRKQKALTISVEVVREFVIERVGHRPMRGRAKVFIVREAERLGDGAQNSLLKTLEEPPPDTFIVLITTATDSMLPTTKSRCQPAVFQPLPADFVTEKLRELRPDAPADELNYAALHSGGSLGGAVRLIEDGLFAIKRAWGEKLIDVVRPSRGFAPHLLAKPFLGDAKTIGEPLLERDPDMSETDLVRAGIRTMLAALAGFYQDAQRRITGADVPSVNADQPQTIDAIVRSHGPRQAVAALRQLAQADEAIGRNANTELTMETTFIELAHIARGQHGRRIAS